MSTKKVPFHIRFTILMIVILVLVGSFFIWQENEEFGHFKAHQQELAQQQALMTAKSIEREVNSIRSQMIAFSQENFGLQNFEDFENIPAVQEALQRRFTRFFPDLYAFTIADETGRELGGDMDLLIGDVCRNDLQLSARMLTSEHPYFDYEPMIHAKFGAYHFDMMIPAFVSGRKLVFFMSFVADPLVNALQEHKISPHTSYIVSTQVSNLIEVSPEGVRPDMTRDYFLNDADLQGILAEQAINGTKWKVVVIENPEMLDNYVALMMREFLVLGLFLFAFWGALFASGLAYEKHRQKQFDNLTRLSYKDGLTGVANREKLKEVLSKLLSHYQAEQSAALIYIDLNNFKGINDAYGHAVGDELLVMLTRRLQDAITSVDLCARMGGDEFVILINRLEHDSEVDANRALTLFIDELRSKLSVLYPIKGELIDAPASVGGVVVDNEFTHYHDLIRRADKAMYREKIKFYEQYPAESLQRS